MQKAKKTYSERLILIGLLVSGIAIGIAFAYAFVALDNAGAFGGGMWKQLKSSLKFEHISDATTLTIWARTGENKLYEQTYCLGDSSCNQWIETKEIVVDPLHEGELDFINKHTCTPHRLKYPPDPRGRVLECALATRYWSNETRDIIYYALLDDGTIWVWRSSGPWYVGLGMFIVLASPIIGLVLGLLMYRSFRKHQRDRIKTNI